MGIFIVADSGSTKTDWVAVSKGGEELFRIQTVGFNPFFHTCETIRKEILKHQLLTSQQEKVEEIYFYGAGCDSKEHKKTVFDALQSIYPVATVFISHDLMAASYATFQGKPTITCILGTGSNSCWFDGKNFTRLMPALGYVLGDEGSGAYFGKKLVVEYMYKTLPRDLRVAFEMETGATKNSILNHVYRYPNANKYLAGFMYFIKDHDTHPYIKKLLVDGFLLFLRIHVLPYQDSKNVTVSFVGSVAFYFRDFLQIAVSQLGLNAGQFMKKPIDALVAYHSSKF